ncbi:MAG: SLC13 family permease, partial [Chloroflexota bacterium]
MRRLNRIKIISRPVFILLLLLAAAWRLGILPSPPDNVEATEPRSLTGRLLDQQDEPVARALVTLTLSTENPTAYDVVLEASTHEDGTYLIDLPGSQFDVTRLSVDIERPHFTNIHWEASSTELDEFSNNEIVRLPDLIMERQITAGFWVATVSFVIVLILIALERLHNALAALLGMSLVLITSLIGGSINKSLFIFDFDQALTYVDFDVVFLLLGMMIVIGVIEATGIFQWLAYQSYRLSGGKPWLLVVFLMLITAAASALLDNVTTMLLMTPITIQIALAIGMNPLTLLLPEVLASNVGGISTLIGTPTNIMIGSYAKLSFSDFVNHLTIGVILSLVVLTLYVLYYYRKSLLVKGPGPSESLTEMLRERGRITQPV